MNQHGGAREGAGRPRKTEFKQMPEPQTPVAWLWQTLERRYGKEDIDALHLLYNERNQAYQKAQIAKQRDRRREIMATLQKAVQAKKENKVVLADWTGRRVTINSFVQNEQTGEWSAEWSHSDYPNSRWDTVSEDQQFIIRGEFGRYR